MVFEKLDEWHFECSVPHAELPNRWTNPCVEFTELFL